MKKLNQKFSEAELSEFDLAGLPEFSEDGLSEFSEDGLSEFSEDGLPEIEDLINSELSPYDNIINLTNSLKNVKISEKKGKK